MKISEKVEFLHEVGGVTIRLTLQQAGRDLLVLLTPPYCIRKNGRKCIRP